MATSAAAQKEAKMASKPRNMVSFRQMEGVGEFIFSSLPVFILGSDANYSPLED